MGPSSDEKNTIGQSEGGGPEEGAAREIIIHPTELFFNSSESMDNLVEHLANGGNVLDFCKLNKIKWSALMRWIESDPQRVRDHEAALEMKKMMMVEKIHRTLDRISHFDIRSIFTPDGVIKPTAEWDDAAGDVIAGIETKELFELRKSTNDEGDIIEKLELIGYLKKVKLWDKTKTVETVIKLRRMIDDGEKKAGADELLTILQNMAARRQKLALNVGPKSMKPAKDQADAIDVESKPVGDYGTF